MSTFFINRPIVAIVIAILMMMAGIVAMLGLPTAQFPNIADPMIQVRATYPGADATTIAESVATPIEQQMSGVSGMNYMYSLSASSGGGMTLYVDFQLGTDINTDQILAQMRQSQAASQLPTAVNNQGVTVQKSTAAPLIMFALFSPNETYDGVFLANYAVININDLMTRVSGIASVSVFGAGNYAMRLWVRPDRLAHHLELIRLLADVQHGRIKCRQITGTQPDLTGFIKRDLLQMLVGCERMEEVAHLSKARALRSTSSAGTS